MTHRNVAVSTLAASTLWIVSVAGSASARNKIALPINSQYSQRTTQQQPQQRTKEMISGTIEKARRRFVLRSVGKLYKLQGAAAAANSVGKRVLVTGILDTRTRTIQVSHIQPLM